MASTGRTWRYNGIIGELQDEQSLSLSMSIILFHPFPFVFTQLLCQPLSSLSLPLSLLSSSFLFLPFLFAFSLLYFSCQSRPVSSTDTNLRHSPQLFFFATVKRRHFFSLVVHIFRRWYKWVLIFVVVKLPNDNPSWAPRLRFPTFRLPFSTFATRIISLLSRGFFFNLSSQLHRVIRGC